MNFQDLEECTYSRDSFSTQPTAVGWLEGDDYTRGRVTEKLIRKLIAIYEGSPFREDLHYRGLHDCPFCGARSDVDTPFGPIHIGARNILLPSAECLYYSPSTIIHYIIEHNYKPPDCYLQAVDDADLSHPEFVDLIVRTFVFSIYDPNPYERRLGDLIATQNGLLGLSGLEDRRIEIIQDEIPGSTACWPPPEGVSAEAAARISSRLDCIVAEETEAFRKVLSGFRDTKWHETLEKYLLLYQEVSAPESDT